MKVWIVEDNGDCETTTLYGIYSTRELAEKAVSELEFRSYDYEISDWEVDS